MFMQLFSFNESGMRASSMIGHGDHFSHHRLAMSGAAFAGRKVKLGFEGGQTPLRLKVPKRGFHNPCAPEFIDSILLCPVSWWPINLKLNSK